MSGTNNQDTNDSYRQVEALGQGRGYLSPEHFILIGQYHQQSVYLSLEDCHVLIEKDYSHLVEPDVQERKGLIDLGLIRIVDEMWKTE